MMTTNVVADHYNELDECGRDKRLDSKILYQRNFNNWIKSVAIAETLKDIKKVKSMKDKICVLDLCAGKGGDLLKWRIGKIQHISCIDIAEVSVEQCKERYDATKKKFPRDQIYTADFFTIDCSSEKIFEDDGIQDLERCVKKRKQEFKIDKQDQNPEACNINCNEDFKSVLSSEIPNTGNDLRRKLEIKNFIDSQDLTIKMENIQEAWISNCSKDLKSFSSEKDSLEKIEFPSHRKHKLPIEINELKYRSFDITSCQFALHYMFGSQSHVETFLSNACHNLKPGGYFIGTTVDAYEMIKRLRRSKDMSFGNNVYNIEFDLKNKENIPLFGTRYNFKLDGVVNCPEYLVYFPLLEKMLEKHNMELIYKLNFGEFYKKYYQFNDYQFLMKKMKALESYSENIVLRKENDAYHHARSFIQKNPDSKIGTLSSPEWEAITLYLAFAFRKRI